MSTTALPSPVIDPDIPATVLEFPDNFLLIDLCGEHDRHIADIELKLGVQILRRGNRLSVHGDPAAQAQAAEVLTALYERLEAGQARGTRGY